MVAIGIMLVLGVMVVSFLRGALTITRTAESRGRVYENAQTVLTQAMQDFSQIEGRPAHPNANTDHLAFVVKQDPWGRQIIAFTRTWGEQLRTNAGYDAARAAYDQGYDATYDGRNPDARMLASSGYLEVVYMFEPLGISTRLWRAESSPAGRGGLIDQVMNWNGLFPSARRDSVAPYEEFDRRGLTGRFELVAENVLAFNVECWDDYTTESWNSGGRGPVTDWSVTRRLDEDKYILPRAVRLNLMIMADDPIRAESPLLGEMQVRDTSLTVETLANFPDIATGGSFVWVDGELMAFGSKSGDTLGALSRGSLGTRAVAHPPNAMVRSGEMFRKIIQLPVTR